MTKRKMKILYVLEHYHPYIGGAEKLFRQLAESLVKEGHEIEVITTLFDQNLPKTEVFNGVKITRVNCYNRFLFSIFSLPAILKKVGRYDLVHTTTYNAALPAWIGAKIKGKKTMLTFHEVWGKLWFQLPFASLFQKSLYYTFEWIIGILPFDHYIAVSDYTKNSLLNIGKSDDQITRIYNGLDYERFSSYPWKPKAGPIEFIYYGRLGISKGLELIVKAVQLLKSQNTKPFTVRLILPKSPKGIYDGLLRLIDQFDINDKIILEHNLTDHELYSRIQTSHCALIPSYSEGFCFTAAEACAIGIPIIHSGRGALSEVVGGENTTLDSLSASDLMHSMLQFLEGEKMQKHPEQIFPLAESVKLTSALYQRISQSI